MKQGTDRLRPSRLISSGPRYVIGVLIVVIVILINVEVALRYFLNLPIGALSEIILLLFPWLSLLGAAVALETAGANVTLQLFESRLGKQARTMMRLFVDLAALVFGIFLILQGTNYAEMTAGEVTNVLGVSMSWDTAAFPVGGILFVTYSVWAIVRLLRQAGKDRPDVTSV